jgi:hypothetical protein
MTRVEYEVLKATVTYVTLTKAAARCEKPCDADWQQRPIWADQQETAHRNACAAVDEAREQLFQLQVELYTEWINRWKGS